MNTLPSKMSIPRRRVLLLLFAAAVTAPSLLRFSATRANADDDRDGGNDGDGESDDGNDGGGSNDDDGGDDGSSDDGDGGHDEDGSDGGSGNVKGARAAKDRGQSSGQRSSQSKDGQLAARLKGRIAPIREIEALAIRIVPGEIADVRLFRSKNVYVYKVRIIQRNGSIYDVRIDAVTRKLISKRER